MSADAGTVRFVDSVGAKDDLNSTLRLDPDGGVDPLGWSVSFLAYDPPPTTGPGCAEGFVSASRYCSTGDAPPAALLIDLGAGDDSVALVNEQPAAPAMTCCDPTIAAPFTSGPPRPVGRRSHGPGACAQS